MQWEELTVPGFVKAVEASRGVVVIPVGVIEPHATHLPLGQDMMTAHWTACEAAKQEPVLVYPPYEWGINHEAAHLPGAIVIKRDLAFALLGALCDEMGRNGLKKIILLNGHGGNTQFLSLFAKTVIERKPSYVVYVTTILHWPGFEEVAEDDEHGHACEMETSTALHTFPRLVKMEDLPDEPFRSLDRHKQLDEVGAYTLHQWYARYPAMYVGDARKANAEKGRVVMERHVADMVRLIRAVKADTVAPGLQAEFLRGWDSPQSYY